MEGCLWRGSPDTQLPPLTSFFATLRSHTHHVPPWPHPHPPGCSLSTFSLSQWQLHLLASHAGQKPVCPNDNSLTSTPITPKMGQFTLQTTPWTPALVPGLQPAPQTPPDLGRIIRGHPVYPRLGMSRKPRPREGLRLAQGHRVSWGLRTQASGLPVQQCSASAYRQSGCLGAWHK